MFGPSRPQAAPPVAAEPARYRLRIPRSVIHELREVTRPNRQRPEPLAFLRVRFASEDSRTVVVAVGVLPFPDEAYVEGPAGANFSTEWAIEVANAGIPGNVGLMLTHSHGGVGMPMFSGVDARTNRSIMAALAVGAETSPFGAVVLSETDARCVLAVASGLTDTRVIVVPDRFGELRVSA
ncbi:MAG TPA: hypothetical protein VMD91_15145 [Candidatus Sulfotelmatobacter sp.]|nr:hypothetical protein [Candidatus Sulfotelmatobacter sp.]